MWRRARAARRFADNVANIADPGRGFREKLREVETVGSADAKRALAEECIKRGRFHRCGRALRKRHAGSVGRKRSGAAERPGARQDAGGRWRGAGKPVREAQGNWIRPPSMPMPNSTMPARWRCQGKNDEAVRAI